MTPRMLSIIRCFPSDKNSFVLCHNSHEAHPSLLTIFAMQDTQDDDAQAPGAPPPYLEQLLWLYGSPKDRGSFMCAGGIADSVTPPNDAPAGPSNKRAAVETEVDSPPKKKSCSTEDYMRELTECIRERSARDRTREQIDVAECMEILRQDGVQEGSELHFKAMDLFRKSVCRTLFKSLQDPENRIKWIDWTWTNGKIQ